MHTRMVNGSSPRPARPDALHVGDVVAGRYQLEREPARTDVGLAFPAVDRLTAHAVAVEVATALTPEARARYAREAQAAQRLENDHVLRVLEAGSMTDGTPFLVREPAIQTLADEIDARGPLPEQEAVARTLEACEAIAEAHALGMTHGGLRPDEVWLGRDDDGMPTAKIDWTSAVRPGHEGGVERDLAGLGRLLRALLVGRADAADESAPTLPNGIAHVVARATTEDGRERYAHVGELARELAPYAPPGHPSARNAAFYLSRVGIESPPARPGAADADPPPRATSTDAPTVKELADRGASGRVRWTVLAFVAAILFTVIVILAFAFRVREPIRVDETRAAPGAAPEIPDGAVPTPAP